jgi:major membrane immunogen (membrane-anchored lipoprotein)
MAGGTMKTLILIIILLTSTICYSQNKPFILQPDGTYKTTDEVVTSYLHDMNTLDYQDSTLIELQRQIKDKQGKIAALDSISKELSGQLNRCTESNEGKDSLIHKLMQPVEVPVNVSFLSWDGFTVNAITSYAFSRAALLKPIVSVLEYGLSFEFGFSVLNKLRFALEPIYFIGNQFKIQAKLGYKLF